jgi:hypothetical protein
MFRSSSARIAVITAAVLVGLGLLRYRPWQRTASTSPSGSAGNVTTVAEGARPKLTVGFLPVT